MHQWNSNNEIIVLDTNLKFKNFSFLPSSQSVKPYERQSLKAWNLSQNLSLNLFLNWNLPINYSLYNNFQICFGLFPCLLFVVL